MLYFHIEEMKVLLNTSDVAKILSVTQKTVYRMINENIIPASKVNGRYIIKSSDLEQYIKKI